MKAVNSNITTKAQELLDYLYEVQGKGIITGQHTQTIPMEERTYIYQQTGKYPKLQGFELLAYSPNINYEDASQECLIEVEENKNTVETAIAWAKETGGIVEICFHWFSPIGGRDKSFYTKHTDFDPCQVLIEGTPERAAFYHDMDVIAEELRKFEKEDIPVLWRPFHEADGTWFWWGAKGIEVARDLYRLMFDYYVGEKALNHLLWVWNTHVPEGYPGDEYVDVISRDVYLPPHTVSDYAKEYEELRQGTGCNKVAALAEVGVIPDIDLLAESKVPWAFYMTWSKEFSIGEEHNYTERLQAMYNHEYSITL